MIDAWQELARARDELIAAMRREWPFRRGRDFTGLVVIGAAFVLAGSIVLITDGRTAQQLAATACVFCGSMMLLLARELTH